MAEKKPQSMPIFGDAYLADTTHLTTEEHGAYFLLMIAAWRQPNCDLPDDDHKLARIVGLTKYKWLKMRPAIIDEFWSTDEDGRLYQKRQQKEYDYVLERSQINSENASQGWEKRKRSKEFSNNSKKSEPKLFDNLPENDGQDTENIDEGGMRNGMRNESPSTSTSPLLVEVEEIREQWNAMAQVAGLAQAKKLTAARQRSAKARLRDHTMDEISEAIRLIPDRDFLTGNNDRGWTATIDWFLRPNTITKLIEGSYDSRKGNRNNGDGFGNAINQARNR